MGSELAVIALLRVAGTSRALGEDPLDGLQVEQALGASLHRREPAFVCLSAKPGGWYPPTPGELREGY
jgi:hypothetical protein